MHRAPGTTASRQTPGPRSLLRRLAPIVLVLLVAGCSGGEGSVAQTDINAIQSDLPTASGEVGAILVREAWIPAPAGPIYRTGNAVPVDLLLVNLGNGWDDLVRATTPVSSQVRLTRYNIPQDFISIPNGRQQVSGVAQLISINSPLIPGQRVPLTMQFRSGNSLTLQIPVQRQPAGPNGNA